VKTFLDPKVLETGEFVQEVCQCICSGITARDLILVPDY